MVTATITTTITHIPTDAGLKGFWSADQYVTSSACPTGSALVASGVYADCCGDTSGDCSFPSDCSACNFPTACVNNTAMYNFKTNHTWWGWPCPTGQYCQEQTIFESYASSTAGWNRTAYWCLDSSVPTAVYRTFEEAEISTITTPSTTRTSATATAATSTPGHHTSHDHKGAIAGGVVGGVAGLAVLAGGIYFIWKRMQVKRKELSETSEFGAEYNAT